MFSKAGCAPAFFVGAILIRHEYILKRRSGLAREKPRVEGFAGQPAPTLNLRCVRPDQ